MQSEAQLRKERNQLENTLTEQNLELEKRTKQLRTALKDAEVSGAQIARIPERLTTRKTEMDRLAREEVSLCGEHKILEAKLAGLQQEEAANIVSFREQIDTLLVEQHSAQQSTVRMFEDRMRVLDAEVRTLQSSLQKRGLDPGVFKLTRYERIHPFLTFLANTSDPAGSPRTRIYRKGRCGVQRRGRIASSLGDASALIAL